jgi:hypothetical protein
MDRRSWWERLIDRDNEAAPVIVIVLFVAIVVTVLIVGPIIDRAIAGR